MESVSTIAACSPGTVEKCQACDPLSTITHSIQVTRIRIANLCCSGEEQIIRTCLENIFGIENVAVNVVGRYAVVKHCPVACCASSERIVGLLNEKYLGASIQEVADNNEEMENECKLYGDQIMHVVTVASLFVIGLIFDIAEHGNHKSMWIYIASTIFGVGPIIYSTGIALFIRFTLDIHVLMLLAIIGAVASGDYFDASLVVSLFLASELVEQLIMFRVRKAVRMSSAGTIPSHAFLVDGTSVPVENIVADMTIAVRAGEMILADGVVLKGEGVVDESALTGESIPVQKYPGSHVRSGTVVQNGYLEVKVTSASAESTLQKLNQEVLDVQADRGQYAKIVDQFSLYWTPTVLVAAITYVLASGGSSGDWGTALHRGLLLLVLACPCAIVIAVPIPAVCAIANAARNGVLIRGSTVVERMGLIDSVALDKTGTLTRGFFKVVNQLVLAPDPAEGIYALAFAAAIEEKSTHPLANAIVSAQFGCIADSGDVSLPAVRKVVVLEGVGMSGWVAEGTEWKHCIVGNERMLKRHGGSVRATPKQEAEITRFAETHADTMCLLVAVDDELMLMLCLADEIRAESVAFVNKLKAMHMQVSMLTGDTELVARNVCETVGIPATSCHFHLLPHQKLEWVRAEQGMDGAQTETVHHAAAHDVLAADNVDDVEAAPFEQAAQNQQNASGKPQFLPKTNAAPRNVLMVGDGINDSTALAAAKVGVAMGAGGSAMAVTAASVVLMSENLLMIPATVRLCQIARSAMIENCTFAISIKLVAIVLAMLGYLEFWHAIVIDLGSLLVVVLNGTKLLKSGVFDKVNSSSAPDKVPSPSATPAAVSSVAASALPEGEGDIEMQISPAMPHMYATVPFRALDDDHDCCGGDHNGAGHSHEHSHAGTAPLPVQRTAVFAPAPMAPLAAVHSCCDGDGHCSAGAPSGAMTPHASGGSYCSPKKSCCSTKTACSSSSCAAKTRVGAECCCGDDTNDEHHSHHEHEHADGEQTTSHAPLPLSTHSQFSVGAGAVIDHAHSHGHGSTCDCTSSVDMETLPTPALQVLSAEDQSVIDHGHSHAHGGTCGSGSSASVNRFQAKLAKLAKSPQLPPKAPT